ncbi:MAG: hypothetical protein ACKVUS_17880 [Saprospiraceae bacterium]
MKYFVRLNEPEFLSQNAARWNQQWASLKARNPGATFQWYRHGGQPVNQFLLPVLATQTQQHCSYCDAFPPHLADETIDHFHPKGSPAFYDQAYAWSNLYYACGHCQKAKMEDFSEDLLWPDAVDYSFERYFIYNYAFHEITPNPDASESEQSRAKTTIDIFQFNHPGQVISRRHAWERWNGNLEGERFIEDFNFRFILMC